MGDEHLSETWMWERAEALLHQADRLKRQFFQLGGGGARGALWEPPADVFEAPDSYVVVVALPGVEPGDVMIRLEGSVFRVAGHRRFPKVCADTEVRRMEIPQGRFMRAVQLPGACSAIEEHGMENGCLIVRLRKEGA